MSTDDEFAEELIKSNFYDAFLFTGKSITAKKIKSKMKRVPSVFEAGSCALAYIGPSANLSSAIKSCIHAAFDQSGMRCIGLKNLFVNEAIFDHVLEECRTLVKEIKVGDPLDKETGVGPILDKENFEAMHHHSMELLNNGYEKFFGEFNFNSRIITPLIYINENASAIESIVERFGPFLCIHKVRNLQSISKNYFQKSSLNASIFSNDADEINYFIDNCSFTGGICLNYGPAVRIDELPFGGYADENENKESIKGLCETLSKSQIITKKNAFS